MGKPSPVETERNLEVYNDYKSGMKRVDMVIKYGISSQRIWAIVRREDEKRSSEDQARLD